MSWKRILLIISLIVLGFFVFPWKNKESQEHQRIYLMCFNERDQVWDRCRMKAEELYNTYEKAEKLGVFCPALWEE